SGTPCRLALFFSSSRRRHTRFSRDWSSDVCSSDLHRGANVASGKFVFDEYTTQFSSAHIDVVGPFDMYWLIGVLQYGVAYRKTCDSVKKNCSPMGKPSGCR